MLENEKQNVTSTICNLEVTKRELTLSTSKAQGSWMENAEVRNDDNKVNQIALYSNPIEFKYAVLGYGNTIDFSDWCLGVSEKSNQWTKGG